MTIVPNSPALADLHPGAPVWVQLPVDDLQATKDFYAGLFSWHYAEDGAGTVAMVDNLPVAGFWPHDRHGAWVPYLNTPHARATAEKAQALGGRIAREPTETSTLIVEPGGVLTGFRSVPPDWLFGTDGHGMYAWAELNTRQGEVTDEFFRQLCGFEVVQIGDGLTLDYTLWSAAGHTVLGRQEMGRAFPLSEPPHWMVYFTAAPEIGTDSVAARVLELGGRVTVEPYDTTVGRITAVTDHAGAVFSVIDPSRKVPLEEIGAPVDDPYDE
ncbi:VOC family protein [Saccharothrix coeruleofusca]|uniref:Glyoxalase n=1 Tax=Saccharothrix coeruleofusca TaxID=33919 RepID=A0A918EC73_9PSEU|nr:VOC family protein [Saccharothrix coeruleofusca]MBP2338512.1 putative enzyme related to lactoylglutathione lyase [Saccharothrix coeruleofusca]GGP47896.1 glyoxalase [Saccharothrix coeruleofusca]